VEVSTLSTIIPSSDSAPEGGPYESAAEARRDVAHILQATRESRDYDVQQALAQRLVDALVSAGVERGGYDRRVIGWIARWEPEVVQTVASWIERAASGGAR
jgi:hypothetical protein